ncbi:hypothetical protein B9Z55_025165 [Caenorhabditis nigoni]|uniref:Uncharacterized protein n=1 Tax=Caenorhabditis nigoni TaxID=1611254 RepID=A0A2G5SXK9_9PELO|nr:hypothetical protein B9Z55_025165 [Caenorhabditis nigoni]
MSSSDKEMKDLTSAMEEVRLSSQPIDKGESSEALMMEEEYIMSADEIREKEFKLEDLQCLEKGVPKQLKKNKDLMMDTSSDLGVLGQMKECILEKNKYIDKKLSEQRAGRFRPFELLEEECFRKIAENVPIHVSCSEPT